MVYFIILKQKIKKFTFQFDVKSWSCFILKGQSYNLLCVKTIWRLKKKMIFVIIFSNCVYYLQLYLWSLSCYHTIYCIILFFDKGTLLRWWFFFYFEFVINRWIVNEILILKWYIIFNLFNHKMNIVQIADDIIWRFVNLFVPNNVFDDAFSIHCFKKVDGP